MQCFQVAVSHNSLSIDMAV